MADREDDQIPEPPGRGNCGECGGPLAPDQRYCLNCGARRGRLPGAVAATLAAISSKGKGLAAATGAKESKGDGEGEEEKGGWSWMPSPPAIAIAVIGMLALGVGIGSAMSEIADSAPISTILLEYPHHAAEASPEEEPQAAAEEAVAEAPEEAAPEEAFEEALPETSAEEPEPVPFNPEEGAEEEELVPFNPEEEGESFLEEEEPLPEIKHAFLIVLGEGGYEETFGATSTAPYLSKTLPKKGELIPDYYGVTGGVLANEIALLSGQGPTAETAVDCPDYAAISPGTVSPTAEQVEGTGCVYADTVQSLPTQLAEKELSWRAYVEGMEDGGAVGQPYRCRKPALGGADWSPTPSPGDQYVTWRNPVVYFSAIAEGPECEKVDVGFEVLSRDLQHKKKTPALSLIFPDACHAGGELECEPGAPKGAQGVASLLKTLVPAIMASPAYEEGGLIAITSAQAPQSGERADPSACCLAPTYPNLASAASSSTATGTAAAEGTETTTYTEESVLPSGGGGKVGLLLISPYVEAGTVEESVFANHFTLLKTLEAMFGVEPLGYAGEAGTPALSAKLFRSQEEVEKEAEEKKKSGRKSSADSAKGRTDAALERAFTRALRSAGGSRGRAGRRRGTS